MLVGLIADTHDNLPKVQRALEVFRSRGVQVILHAGDFVSPFSLRLMLQAQLPFFGVFGNNDGERTGLRKLSPTLCASPRRIELDSRVIILAHEPEHLSAEAVRGAQVLVHGHTHQAFVEPGPPLKVNPGEAGGWLTGRSTVALLDLAALRAEIVELGSQETVTL